MSTIYRVDLQKVMELVYVALCASGDQTVERVDLYRLVDNLTIHIYIIEIN